MNAEQLDDYEALWIKSTKIGEVIRKHMDKEHQEHYFLLCQLQYLCNELVPTLDHFFNSLTFDGATRLDLWRLGDRLLDDYVTCKRELEKIDQADAERRAKEPPPPAS